MKKKNDLGFFVDAIMKWDYGFYQTYIGYLGFIGAFLNFIFYFMLKYGLGFEESIFLRGATVLSLSFLFIVPRRDNISVLKKTFIELSFFCTMPLTFYLTAYLNDYNKYWFGSVAFCGFIQGILSYQLIGIFTYALITLMMIASWYNLLPSGLMFISTSSFMYVHIIISITYIMSATIRSMLQANYNGRIQLQDEKHENKIAAKNYEILKNKAIIREKAEKAELADDFFHSIKNYTYALDAEFKHITESVDANRIGKMERLCRDIASKALAYRQAFRQEGYYYSEKIIENVGLMIESITETVNYNNNISIILNNSSYDFYSSYIQIQSTKIYDAIINLVINAIDEVSKFKVGNIGIHISNENSLVKIKITNKTFYNLPENVVLAIEKKISSSAKENKEQERFTYGKIKGSGIGLDYIGEDIRKEGGSIEFNYSNNTVAFNIMLPTTSTPLSELQELVLFKGDNVILVDNTDQYLHGKIFSLKDIHVFQYASPDKALEKIEILKNQGEIVRLFVDWNLGNKAQNGLDFVILNSLEGITTIITKESDRGEYRKIQVLCNNKNINLLHKNKLRAQFPIKIKNREEVL